MDRHIRQSSAESVVRDTSLEGRKGLDAITSRQLGLQLLSVLGQGSFGLVVLAQQASSQRQVAVKIFLEDSSEPSGTRRVMQEASIMQLLRHPNIVELLEVGRVGHYHCLVMELVDGGDLYQYVMEQGCLPEPEAVFMFDQVLAAVGHCHALRVAHRDLKLGNLLLDSQLNVKLADFGLSSYLPVDVLVQGFRGTPEYSAPEVFQQEPYDAFASDMWSLGVILFTMLAGIMPFSGKDLVELRECIQRGSYQLPCGASRGLEKLLSSLLSRDPCDRPTAEIALQQWWFDPLLEGAEGEELSVVQPLAVPEDPEAQEYLAGLGLLPDAAASEPSGPGGSSRMSLQPHSGSLEQGQREPESECEAELESESEPESASQLESESESESLPQPELDPAAAGPVVASPLPGQLQERSPGASPAPEPVPVAAPSTPSPGSSPHLVVPEVPAAEPEEAGPSASASVPSKGRQGLGRRIGRSILGFLLRACCLPAPARGPGPRSRKVAPR
ncbi:serine/threonine-protein kinase MARK2-like [Oryctolagus cuniculus]|uniref:non-specific serine/threonine protein kinase n=1 Tax=Oryctolagus cuniculus TaxID=9986 RepID=U3KPE3_RABIT|nr:serine/threonine-protein kinase MARK2-like [Oryctolagus cuniculus]XP_051708770.1 serine/threonine-protein kinase MARK2-like [Oryctolagus cuniculus]